MTRVLVIKSSARGAQSASNAMADAFKTSFAAKNPEAIIDELDLATEDVPALTGDTLSAFFTPAEQRTANQVAVDARSLQLIERLQKADTVAIAYGLYNFSVPVQLRHLIDQVTRAGLTFKYTENGPVGLITGKKLVLLAATGGVYSEGPAKAYDFGTPYLRVVLGFIGMTDVTVVTAEGLAMASDQGAAILEKAKAEIAAL